MKQMLCHWWQDDEGQDNVEYGMLADEKSTRFVRDFLGQWLRLYQINATVPVVAAGDEIPIQIAIDDGNGNPDIALEFPTDDGPWLIQRKRASLTLVGLHDQPIRHLSSAPS